MRIVCRRLAGAKVRTLDLEGFPASREVADLARETLASYYTSNEHSFWPLPTGQAAAEEVVILGDDGAQLASYSIINMIADTKKSLVGNGRFL